jgi:hypothetical protein
MPFSYFYVMNKINTLITGSILILVTLNIMGCSKEPSNKNKYSNILDSIPEKAELFAPGLVSTGMNERDFSMNPEMNEMYFTINEGNAYAIVFSKLSEGEWTAPEVVTFNSDYNDIEPFVSPDGERLYFSSDRPFHGKNMGFDIWYVTRQKEGWGSPVRLDSTVNSEKNEFYPSVALNKNLYFTEHNDYLVKSEFKNGEYQNPQKLSDSINTGGHEFNAFIAPDESYILFTSYGWPQTAGRGDLFISHQNSDGSWTKAQCLDKSVNSSGLDFCPYVSPDSKTLFFSSRRKPENQKAVNSYNAFKKIASEPQNGKLDIYFMSAKNILP